jgi:Zn-dependent M28 family amino/carboxypeptidase
MIVTASVPAAALVEVARLLVADPPAARVILLSTDSEESLLEGMRAFLLPHQV